MASSYDHNIPLVIITTPTMEPTTPPTTTTTFPTKSYALSGKIMLTAIIVLFSVMIIMVLLHLYARWYLRRIRRRHPRRRRTTTHLIFYSSTTPSSPSPRGLDPSILSSLPVFLYSSTDKSSAAGEGKELLIDSTRTKSGTEDLRSVNGDSKGCECVVCLSEFEEGEKVRLLPICNHRFHIECIDMWFHSHSTCPICRSAVERYSTAVEKPNSSLPCATCSTSGGDGDRRKGLRVTVEIPRRTGFETELGASSPAGQGFRSPAGRLISRILSMNLRTASSPNSGVGTSCDSVIARGELDIERGRGEPSRSQARADMPR